MKKIIIPFILLLPLIGCNNSDDICRDNDSELCIAISKRSPSNAIEIAQSIDGMGNGQATSRSAKNIKAVYSVTKRTSRSASDTLMYAVQYEDNGGFAIVAAPKCVEPLIAVVEDGSFNSYETIANEPFQSAMTQAANYINDAVEKSSTAYGLKPILAFYYDTVYTTNQVGPVLNTRWGQRWPMGMHCRNGIAGCGPLAVVEIMSAVRKPQELAMTYQGKTTTTGFPWSIISKHIGVNPNLDYSTETQQTEHYDECSVGFPAHQLLADMCAEVGFRVGAKYNQNSTSSDPYKLVYVLEQTTGLTSVRGYSAYKLDEELRCNNGIAFVWGYDDDINAPELAGHAWVADGSRHVECTVNYYEWANTVSVSPSLNNYKLVSSETTIIPYIHYNWGWNGNCNGWFSANIFAPGEAHEYDNSNNNGNPYNFDYNFNFRAY